MTSPVVFDVTAADFQSAVLERSLEVPVLLDFWASWCGPCRTLTPVLERLAADYGGGFVLGKVDTETERELAAAFQVQSIPFVVLIAGGRPVDAFAGALPEPEVRAFLERHGVQPQAAEETPEEAEPEDPDAPVARLKAGLAAAGRADVATARERLEGIPEEEPEAARAGRILDGLAIHEAGFDASAPAAVPLSAGRDALRAGDLDAAVEAFLDSMAVDKAFAEGLARRAAVLCFELMSQEPDGEERATAFRRRMAGLLY